MNRTPFFCSGCPHNISTRVPAGSLVGGGIGCHAMVAMMEPERVGDIAGLTAMGNEGAQWIGMAPFVDRPHIIQNLGDGTYFHSGSLAVRAAVAAGVNITFKLLYNGTVAMTGGQDPQGQLDVPGVVQALLIEGVQRVIVTTDDLDAYDHADFGSHARPRRRVGPQPADRGAGSAGGDRRGDRARPRPGVRRREAPGTQPRQARQARLPRRDQRAGLRGVRRLRRQEQLPVGAAGDDGVRAQDADPPDELQLRHDVPGGRLPVVRPRVRRRHGGDAGWRRRRDCRSAIRPRVSTIPTPIVPTDEFIVRLSGIGGTGVVTVSQILGTAAMLAGRTVRGLDQTGLSQKAGPVVSDLRISANGTPMSNRANSAGVDCFLAFDLLVGASDSHRTGARAGRTVVIGSAAPTPTGAMVTHPTTPYPELDLLTGRLAEVSRGDDNRYPNAAAITSGLFGDATTANMFLLGVAVQAGAIPIESVADRAGDRAQRRRRAAQRHRLALGSAVARHPDEVEQAAGVVSSTPQPETLDELIERLADDLTDYQSARYAERFRRVVAKARQAEQRVDAESLGFTDAVARNLHKLMAYKDEYEVARLLLLPESRAAYEAVGGPQAKVTWRLASANPARPGQDSTKIEVRAATVPMFKALRAAKRVRGTPLDPFRWAEVRRVERAMIPEYIRAVETLCAKLTAANLAEATAIAALPDQVRGYEDVKLPRAKRYRAGAGRTSRRLRLDAGSDQARRMIWSARSKATARWLTAMTVSPAAARFSHRRTSVSTSTALERSSRTTSSGRWTSARAVARRWRWPPERRRPRGPISVADGVGHRRHLVGDRRQLQGRDDRRLVHRSERDVVAHRVGHELGYLGQERGVRRHEEGAGIVDRHAVPAHHPGDLGTPSEAEHRPQQRRLAGADRAGDDGEAAALDDERHRPDARAVRVAGRQADDLEALERHPRRPHRVRAHALLPPLDRQVALAHGVVDVGLGDEHAHPVEGDAGLLAAGEQAPDHPRQEAQPAEVGGEQRERADGEAAVGDRRGADDEHDAEADVGGAVAEGEHALAEHPVAYRRLAAPLDEPFEPGEEVLGGAVDLDRGRRRHHVADESGDVTRGEAVGLAVGLDPAVGEAGHEHDADHRQQQHRRGPGVGHPEDDPGGDAEHEAGRHVDDAVDQPGDVLDVVAEVGERLAGRTDRLAGLRPAARHLRLEQVGPQERLHVHPRLRPHDRRVVDHRHAQQLDDAEQRGVAVDGRRLARR